MDFRKGLLFEQWHKLTALGPGGVRVFGLRIDDQPDLPARASLLLSSAERERAERILVTRARDEFLVGRAALRFLAGAVLGLAPAEVDLEIDVFGKPHIFGVYSNVTHSRGQVYVALSHDTPVGIDVEWIDPSLEALELADANFTPKEAALIAAQPKGEARASLFCALWTRKEAVAKAYGRGLRIPLQRIGIPCGVAGAAWVEMEADGIPTETGGRAEFYVQDLSAPQGFAVAVAVQGTIAPHVSMWSYGGGVSYEQDKTQLERQVSS